MNDMKKGTPEGAPKNQFHITTEGKILSILESSVGAISREELAKLAGVPDRTMRAAIRRLRLAGYTICNAGDGCGYWLGDDLEYYRTSGRDHEARLRSESRIASIHRGRVPLEGQETIDMG